MPAWNTALDMLTAALSAVERGAHAATLPPADHRPWPVPDEPWIMGQRWNHLLFAHWPVAPDVVMRHVPAALPLDTFDGHAWIGVTPFVLDHLRVRGLPPVPGLSVFPEINVRTYVTRDGKPGVFFFSLDAGSALAAAAARRLYALPYHHADFSVAQAGLRTRYTCRRKRGAPAVFDATYEPTAPAAHAAPGTLEAWLMERYCLYAVDAAHWIHRAEIHHVPWPLQPARAVIRTNTMAAASGLSLSDRPPLLHYAEHLDVMVWRPTRVAHDHSRRG